MDFKICVCMKYYCTKKESSKNSLNKERETGFEPATPTLARLYSTPEPLAHTSFDEAGDGNRTHISSLEGWCSTTELHLHCSTASHMIRHKEINVNSNLKIFLKTFQIIFNILKTLNYMFTDSKSGGNIHIPGKGIN